MRVLAPPPPGRPGSHPRPPRRQAPGKEVAPTAPRGRGSGVLTVVDMAIDQPIAPTQQGNGSAGSTHSGVAEHSIPQDDLQGISPINPAFPGHHQKRRSLGPTPPGPISISQNSPPGPAPFGPSRVYRLFPLLGPNPRRRQMYPYYGGSASEVRRGFSANPPRTNTAPSTSNGITLPVETVAAINNLLMGRLPLARDHSDYQPKI
ncbi:basic proline-rich protein-like [Diachasmimorpha longicaudata]|uniref:basic proline-rich protein-like n=1 Tax=Diachasmimorpha longicaudata TaxID=58733 RepID=UPI0030B8A356